MNFNISLLAFYLKFQYLTHGLRFSFIFQLFLILCLTFLFNFDFVLKKDENPVIKNESINLKFIAYFKCYISISIHFSDCFNNNQFFTSNS